MKVGKSMDDLQLAKNELQAKDVSCVVCKNGTLISSQEHGIKPIVCWLAQEETFFQNACVADKIIGKAAALLLVYGGVQRIFATVISEPAVQVLEENKVAYLFEKRVPYIINRDGTDMCPMEKRVLAVSSPKQAYEMFHELILNTTNK